MSGINTGIELYMRREYDKALQIFRKVAKRKSDDPEANIMKGLALYNLGRYPEVLEACRIAMNYGGDLSEEYEEIGSMHHDDKMYDEASEYLLAAAFMDEIIMKAKYVRAKALFRMGVRDEAIHEINFEMKLDPDNPDERHILTMILSEMCHMEDMGYIKDMGSEGAASIEHMHGRMYRNFWSHHEEYMEKLKGRLNAADLAVGMRGDDAGNHAARAKILFDMECYQDALEAIIEALSLNPLNARYHYVQADVLRMLGRMPECRQDAEESLSLDPDDQEARALNGFCLYKEGRLDEGRAMIDAAYWKDAASQMTCCYMAYVMYEEGERKKALDVCKSAVLRHPEKQELRFLLAAMLEDALVP